ncbi:MAG: T9SS type A sorting domain-containing protein, partial [Syntrophorhabdus sp.]
LNMNHHITAKRQWSLLSGAAGQETTLTALQYTPSTGSILWAGAAVSLPANQNPAIHLSASDLFSFSTPVTDELLPSHQFAFSCAPNPVSAAQTLRLSGSQPLKSLALYNLRGQKILDLSFSGNKSDAEISLPALPAGVYLTWVQGVSGSSAQSKLLVLP